jgi:hypothetical protein
MLGLATGKKSSQLRQANRKIGIVVFPRGEKLIKYGAQGIDAKYSQKPAPILPVLYKI